MGDHNRGGRRSYLRRTFQAVNLKNMFATLAGVAGVGIVAFLFASPFAVTYMLLTQ
jgi:hypothetical protein